MSELVTRVQTAVPSAKLRVAHEPYVVLNELMAIIPSLHSSAFQRGTCDWMPARRPDRIALRERLPAAEELPQMFGLISDALQDRADSRQMAQILGSYLALFRHQKLDQDPEFLDGLLFQLEIECRLQSFSAQVLCGSLRELCTRQRFFPMVAEIITTVRELKSRFEMSLPLLQRLLELRQRLDEELGSE
jgi:hypothetical protein